MLHIVDVNGDNWLCDLNVAGEQMDYVLDAYGILARAYAYRDEGSRAFFIYDDDTPVGMGLYCDYPDLNAYELNQFFIDERYQGRGYGRAALELVLDEMRQVGRYRKVVLWYIDGDNAARNLYGQAGFTVFCHIKDEIGMEMNL